MSKTNLKVLEKKIAPPGNTGQTVVIAYVPALHEGYRKWWTSLPEAVDCCYLIDESLLGTLPRAERDVSRIPAHIMAPTVAALGLFPAVIVLDKATLASLHTSSPTKIYSHRHIVTKHVLGQGLGNIATEFTDIFLRWDMGQARAEQPADADVTITHDRFHQEVLKSLNTTANQSKDWWRQVAAVAYKDGKALLPPTRNQHVPFEDIVNWEGDPRSWLDAGENPEITTAFHSEQALIAAAAREGISLKGADLYVTTFPCPVCAKLVAGAGFARCYFAEGYSQTGGARVLKAAGVKLIQVK